MELADLQKSLIQEYFFFILLLLFTHILFACNYADGVGNYVSEMGY